MVQQELSVPWVKNQLRIGMVASGLDGGWDPATLRERRIGMACGGHANGGVGARVAVRKPAIDHHDRAIVIDNGSNFCTSGDRFC